MGGGRTAASRRFPSALPVLILWLMANQMVSFRSNGQSASGYLATPAVAKGPGLLVIQEWWGLTPDVTSVTDQMADAGFVALAPDLYHGQSAQHTEMDKASQLMQNLPPERAARDMSGAVDFLAAHAAVVGRGLGVIGFCMGGMLSLLVAANRGDRIKAAVPFYGFPQGAGEPDWTQLSARVQGHMAERDDFFPPAAARALEAKLRGMGKDVTMTVHQGTGHAFMGPHNALGTLDAALAARIWPQVTAFLHATLD
jgi:carboxymethylenebutenolidase